MDYPLSLKDLSRTQFLAERAMNVPLLLLAAAVALTGVLFANPAAAASTASSAQPVYLFGIPVDFILFGLTLLAVAVFHHKTLEVALTGLVAVTLYKLLFTGFRQGESLNGLMQRKPVPGRIGVGLSLGEKADIENPRSTVRF